jgi:hypothetical protein
MFYENHHKILQAIALGCTSPSALAEMLSLSDSLVIHLLNELDESGFIKRMRAFPFDRAGPLVIIDICLIDKGRAAIDSPNYFLETPMASDKNYTWTGDRVSGDKIGGDKVMGNKVQIGTVQGDAVAGNKIVNAQDLTQAAQDIKALLDQLAIDYPDDDEFTQAGRAISKIKQNPTIKQRLGNALKESGTTAVEKAIESVTNHPAVSVIVAGVKGFIEAEG